MELSLRLDTLGMVELRYLRGRERYRDWPPFLFVAASRQARVLAYMNRDVVDQLHHQILAVEEAAGLGSDDEDDDEAEDSEVEENEEDDVVRTEEELGIEESLIQVELALVLRLYEEGHAKPDDLPAVELQLDVDDFERLHETLDFAIDRERRSSRRRSRLHKLSDD